MIGRALSRVSLRTINQTLHRNLHPSCIRSFSDSAKDISFDDFDSLLDELDNPSPPQPAASGYDAGKWGEILDPANPPKLSVKHYELLTKIAGRKPQVAIDSLDPVLDESIINMQRMLNTLATAAPEIKSETQELGSIVEEQYRLEAARLATPPPAPIRPKSIKLSCRFCAIKKRAAQFPELKIEYTNLSLLHRFINLRGMIYPRRVTGNCIKHQRKLANAVKRARFIGLLSYTSNWSVDGIQALESMVETIPDINVSEIREMQPTEEFFETPAESFHPQDFTPNDPNALPSASTAQ